MAEVCSIYQNFFIKQSSKLQGTYYEGKYQNTGPIVIDK